MDGTATILLVHGAWHGPWCWARLEPALAARHIPTRTVALPSCGPDPATLGTLADDARAVAEAATAIPGDVIVAGHSYGGMAITEAAFGTNVRRLVYLCAFKPVEGASLISHLPGLPPFVAPGPDGSIAFVSGLAAEYLYSDCPPDVAADATRRLVLHSLAATATPVTRCAWRTIPSTYVVATADRILPVEMQRAFAGQAGDSRDIAAGHMPMLSRPDELAGILAELATAGSTRRAARA